jgi:hypothetical protein
MLLVNCVIHGDIPDAGSRCSFFIVSNPVTLSKIKENFPFEGEFHFRRKVKGFEIGFQDETEYFWFDLINDNEEIFIEDNSTALQLQVVPIRIPQNFVDVDYDSYLLETASHINERLSFDKPDEAFEDSFENPHRQKNNSKILISNIAKSIAPQLQQLDNVKSGVTNIWKTVKAATLNNIPLQNKTVDLQAESLKNLTKLSSMLTTSFDYSNSQHDSLIRKLWSVLFLEQSYEKVSMIWKQAGFQKEDPTADLKTSGVLSILSMTFLCENFVERSQKMLSNNKNNVKTSYPFAIVGVNITLLLADLFGLKDQKFFYFF